MVALRQDYDKGDRIIREMYGAVAPQPARSAAPVTINVDTVQAALRPHIFSYRGTLYTIKHVPWLDGIALEFLADRIQVLLQDTVHREVLAELYAMFDEALAIMWRLTAKPWWRRRNPFAGATMGEFFALATFYFECRMLLPNLALDTTTGSHQRLNNALQRTLRTAWHNSPKLGQRGWGLTAHQLHTICSRSVFAGSTSSTPAQHFF